MQEGGAGGVDQSMEEDLPEEEEDRQFPSGPAPTPYPSSSLLLSSLELSDTKVYEP